MDKINKTVLEKWLRLMKDITVEGLVVTKLLRGRKEKN